MVATKGLVLLFVFVSILWGVEPLETYSYDGSGNNHKHLSWGAAGTARIRSLPPFADFYDGNDIPRDENNSNLPSARRVMEDVFRKAKAHKDKTSNHLLLELGHFVVQDTMGSSMTNLSESFPVPCDGNFTDILFCPVTGRSFNLSNPEMNFFRMKHVRRSVIAPRATLNGMTAFLDLSQMYGLDESRALQMRGGLAGGLLKLDDQGLVPRENIYWGGMNTSPGAFALYVIFMRYHNRMAKQYALEDLSLSDDELFQKARLRTIAIYQSIVEEKYIPTLLGDSLDNYTGYKKDVNPSIDEFFATVSFRYAHSSFTGVIRLLDKYFKPTPDDPLYMRDIFKAPPPDDVATVVERLGGVEPFLRGLTMTAAKAVDASIVDDLNVWSEATSVVDVQRGRDVGIPPYNDVREAFGLPRMQSIEELAGGDIVIAAALRNLYNDDVDKVDAYVGALIEEPVTGLDAMGPLFTNSIKDQFTRFRDGDRLWYKNLYEPEEYEKFPTLSEMIKEVCEEMDLFPIDSYKIVVDQGSMSSEGDDGVCGVSRTQLSLLGGGITVAWSVEDPSSRTHRTLQAGEGRNIDVTVSANERMEGTGYIGIGWGKQEMNGAEIWFCTVNKDVFDSMGPLPLECQSSGSNSFNDDSRESMFLCCVAPGGMHSVPACAALGDNVFYELDVIDWCLSTSSSSVTVRSPVCSDQDGDSDPQRNCFRLSSTPEGKMDFIVAYNPFAQHRPHGYQRRTAAQVDLNAGILTKPESEIADTGLLATHAIFMLVAWMLLAPWAIFIARFMKTRTWRLVAHISLMGVVGSLLIPLLIGVEASVGATDKKAEHSVVGLIMVLVYFFMAAAGRIRYLKLAGHMVGKKSDLYSKILHIYGGYVILVLAWWNCYTGLVRIGPEDSYAQIIVLSSYPMGYNVPIFGHIRKYVFSPYISFVILVFLIAEIRLRRKNTKHGERLERYLDGTASILTWDDDKDKVLETMTIETFLDVTRLGSALCIVDGRVLDITDFMDVHPGGRDILRFASGADVTEELLGLRDVGGIKHAHTNGALNLLKKLVKAKLVNANSGKNSPSSEHFVSIPKRLGSIGPPGDVSTKSADTSQGSGRVPPHTTRPKQGSPGLNSQAFRPGRVLAMKYLTPAMDLTKASKPVIMLRLSLPRHSGSSYHNQKDDAPFLPSFAFTFRAVDKRGSTVERQYTPVNLDKNLLQDSIKGIKQSNNQSEDEVYAFLISLIPGGQMSTFLMGLKVGKTVLVQGPKINPKTLAKVDSLHWKSVVMLAAGTGISPILQLIDHYLASQSDGRPSPQLFLVWILKSPQHAYPEAVDLNERVKFSSGRFKWVIIYSSSGSKKQSLQRGRGSMDVVDRSGEDDEKDMFWDLRDAGGKDTFTRSWWGGTVIGKQPLKARESLKDMIVMERDKCSPTLAEEFAMHSDDESVEFDAGFWSSSHRCLTRKCDIFLLGDVLSSIDEYVKVGDCDTEKEVDSSQVLLEEAHSTTPRKNYGANIYQIFGNKLGANISSTTRLGSVEGEDEIAFERKVKNPRSSKIQKVKKQILDAISLSRHIDPGEVSTNGAISEGSHDGCAPGNDQGAGNGLSDKISEHEAQAPDVEEGLAQRKFQNVLVAVSGSPMFEVEILPNLKKLGLPSEQVVIFHTSTVQI